MTKPTTIECPHCHLPCVVFDGLTTECEQCGNRIQYKVSGMDTDLESTLREVANQVSGGKADYFTVNKRGCDSKDAMTERSDLDIRIDSALDTFAYENRYDRESL